MARDVFNNTIYEKFVVFSLLLRLSTYSWNKDRLYDGDYCIIGLLMAIFYPFFLELNSLLETS